MRINSSRDNMPYISTSSAKNVRQPQSARTSGSAQEIHSADRDQVRLSPVARQLQRAEQLLAQELAPRSEKVEQGKQILANWRELDDATLDALLARLVDEEG